MERPTPSRDYITVSNWIAFPVASAVAILVATQLPGMEMMWLAGLIFLALLAGITFGLNWLLLHGAGLGRFATVVMTVFSFLVAVIQMTIWWKDWPL